jgi:hypothetical protein
LRRKLALAGGVSIAPGGDAGPAGSIPEIWGLREADAFLLIVERTSAAEELRQTSTASSPSSTGSDFAGSGSTFDYSLDRLDVLQAVESGSGLRDRRNFVSAYAQSEWTPATAWRIDTGLRLKSHA